MAALYLEDYIKELRREGDKAFRARHAQPVLVVTRAGEGEDVADSGETTVLTDTSGWRLHEASLVDRVFVVSRGAFAKPGPVTLGRSDTTDLTISDKSVSKRHCLFEAAPEGVRLQDLGSTNGTSVDGEALAPNTPRVLKGGELVDIGSFELLYQTPDGFLAFLRARL
jgi:hypothetical protein